MTSDARVVDFGAHFTPADVPLPDGLQAVDRDYLGGRLQDWSVAEPFIEAAGVDAAVLSQPFYMGHGDLEATRVANDGLLEVFADRDDLYGLAAVPTDAGGDAAAAELERCLEAGYHGGAIETMSEGGVELVDDAVEPVLELADETGAPLLVHPKLHRSLGADVLDERYLLNSTIGRDVGLMESICKVVHTGVLDRYPDLTLVYHHLGGNLASMMGVFETKLEAGRWPDQDHVKSFAAFKAQLEERVYVDTSGYFGYHAPLRATLEEFPTERVLFGSDIPFRPRSADEVRDWIGTVEDLTPDADAARILGANALDLLYGT